MAGGLCQLPHQEMRLGLLTSSQEAHEASTRIFCLADEKTALEEDQPITLRLRSSVGLLLGLAESV